MSWEVALVLAVALYAPLAFALGTLVGRWLERRAEESSPHDDPNWEPDFDWPRWRPQP